MTRPHEWATCARQGDRLGERLLGVPEDDLVSWPGAPAAWIQRRAGPMFVAEPPTFAVLLRRLRLAAGLSQAELAGRAGLSERAVSDLERGLHPTPQRQTVAMLAEGLGLSSEARAQLEGAVARRRGPIDARQRGAAGRTAAEIAVPASPCRYPFPTPERLIGREAELERLDDVLRRSQSSGRLVLLGAPAGTGKSALTGALVRRAEAMGFLCLAGAAQEQEGAAPFAPIGEAVASYLMDAPREAARA